MKVLPKGGDSGDVKPDFTYQQGLLKDTLSEETRKERRNLLGASAVGIVIAKAGLVPNKISALGIDFSQADQRTFLLVLAGVTAYFFVAFAVYALVDFQRYRMGLSGTHAKHFSSHLRLPTDTELMVEAYFPRRKRKQNELITTIASEEYLAKTEEWIAIHRKLSALGEAPETDEKIEERLYLEAAAEQLQKELSDIGDRDRKQRAELMKTGFQYLGSTYFITLARLVGDFLVPFTVGGYAIVSLVWG